MDIERAIETWSGPLVGLLAGWGAPWRDAHELAQDAIVEAYLARERFVGDADDPADMGPWLRGIARHLFLAWRRKTERRREEALEDIHAAPVGIAREARSEVLLTAIARLPEELRTALYLHYLQECGVREVAALLGAPPSTVQGRLYRARQALREALAAEVTTTDQKESRR
jgi:RNA polymerase sigma factor (sigma-70 family)